MRTVFTIALFALLFHGCTSGQPTGVEINLSATEFAEKLKTLPNAPLIDVRTAEEFSKGHLANALNYDWNGSTFEQQIATLDKSAPVFVYCLSGGRSAAAASKMRSTGFTEVYEMNGGMMKWRGANLPETTAKTSARAGMSKSEFDKLLDSDKLVLIDFYADWCVPCKKMKPYLDEISTEMADQVAVVRINADDHQSLCKELGIDALPVLHVYKDKTLQWSNSGYIEKAEVVKQLN